MEGMSHIYPIFILLTQLINAFFSIFNSEEDLEQFYVEVTEKSSSLPRELIVPSTKTAAELNCFLQGK